MRKLVVLCIVLFCVSVVHAAIDKIIPLKTFGLSDNLAGLAVSSIHKDRQGFLWIASQAGVSRYDGYKFQTFRVMANSSNSLINNHVRTIAEDSQGRLWFGTIAGLSIYDPKTETFTNFSALDSQDNSLPHSYISQIFIDEYDNAWIKTNNGVVKFNLSSKKFSHLTTSGLSDNKASSMNAHHMVLVGHTLWLIAIDKDKKEALFSLDTKAGKLKPQPTSMLELSKKGKLDKLIAFNQTSFYIQYSNGNIYLFDTTNNAISLAMPYSALIPSRTARVFTDGEKGLWIAPIKKGLWHYDFSSKVITRFHNAPEQPYDLANHSVRQVYQDHNQIWLGIYPAGLSKLNRNALEFDLQIPHSQVDNGLNKNPIVLNQLTDKNGDKWLATYNQGLLRWNSNEHRYEKIHTANDKIKSYAILAMFLDANDDLWVGTSKKGLFRLNKHTMMLDLIAAQKGAPVKLGYNKVNSIIEYPKGILWFTQRNKDLVKLNTATNEITYKSLRRAEAPSSSKPEYYYTDNGIFLDRDNAIWIGTRTHGAIKYQPDTDEVTIFEHFADDLESIPDNYVTGFAQDSNGTMWFSTGAGIATLNEEGKFTNLHLKHGKGEEIVTSIVLDRKERAWFGVSESLGIFDLNSQSFNYIDKHSGSASGSYIDGSGNLDANGNISYGSRHGVVSFDPLKIQKLIKREPPKTLISSFYINNVLATQSNNLLPTPVAYAPSISLDYLQNNFGVGFASTDFTTPSETLYQYRLLGYDDAWVTTAADNRRATYTNMDAGTFRFEVRAKTGRTWGPISSIDIRLTSAPWRTWWAYLLYSIAVLTIVSNFIYQRIKIHQSLKLRAKANEERAKAVEERNEQLSLTSKLFDNTSQGVWLVDSNLTLLAVNDSFVEITGYKSDEVVGRQIRLAQVKGQGMTLQDNIFERVKTNSRWTEEIWDERKNGEVYPAEMVIDKIELTDSQGVVFDYQFIGIFSDITQRHRAEQELLKLSHFDSLTGLANRTQFKTLLQATIERALAKDSRDFFVLYLDVDNFKNVNDAIGHSAGDDLIKAIATKLKNLIKAPATLARLGGDEFAIMYPPQEIAYNVTEFAAHIIEQVLSTLRISYECEGYHFSISASIGAVTFPNDGMSVEALLRNADTAMYNAKNSGRDNGKFYSDEMNKKALERLDYENHLSRAIHNDELKVFIQPKLNIATGRFEGGEILARWHNPVLGWVRPDIFIAFAEETGLILEISDHLLRKACEMMKPFVERGEFCGRMAFNLSAVQFTDPLFLSKIDKILAETSFPCQHLEFEVTETVMMSDVEHGIELMNCIRQRGITIALDDFGTGYSSLSYLKQFPLDILKVDRAFVSDMDSVKEDANMVKSIVELAHNLGLKVVAEGVENQTQLDILREFNCDVLQGYFYAKPLSEDEFGEFIAQLESEKMTL